MSPYPIAPPSDEELLAEAVEQQSQAARTEQVAPSSGQRPVITAPRGKNWLSEAMLDMSPTRPGRRTVDFVLSLLVHAIFLGTLLLIPLYFTEAIDLKQFTQTFLVAPPPPPPPASPAIARVASARKRVFTATGKLLAPTAIPEKIAMLKEEPLPPDVGPAQGVMGGVPGGVPGGQIGGVLGGILSGAARTNMPVAPAAPPRAPIRVGGRVKAPRFVSRVDPVYPLLARQARIEGQVLIDAVIDANGEVVEMQVISGHPLLIPAALEALRHWKYEPTYLNEQPVPVKLLVVITFRIQ